MQATAPQWALDPPLSFADLVLPETIPTRSWPQTYHSDFEKDDVELNTYWSRCSALVNVALRRSQVT